MQAAPLRALIALVLAVLTLTSGGCSRLRAPAGPASDTPLAATAAGGALQEVAPPAAVLQVQERLDGHAPRIRITAPADDALVAEGPWQLRLEVSDWPMVPESGVAGPHLVVQLDQQPAQQLGADAVSGAIPMPALTPGSHRLTVYAARPWGEAVKSPGAVQQIRLHRVGRNAPELPQRGSPQLIVASPDGESHQEPVLIDWLLLDAPLQNLRDDDARWRLRVSVNGDSFLVDRQTPLWLKGFKRGSNAVQLELLDGRGEALNPPFNSVVREVVIDAGQRPAWMGSSLNAETLAILSGEAGPAAGDSEAGRSATTTPKPAAAAAEPTEAPTAEPDPTPAVAPSEATQVEEPAPTQTAAEPVEERTSKPDAEFDPEPKPRSEVESGAPTSMVAGTGEAPDPASAEAVAPPTEEPEQPQSNNNDTVLEPQAVQPPTEAPTPPAPPERTEAPAAPTERLRAASSLGGSAREQVNADGSLQQPARRGPLAGLREKLGG